MSIFAAINFLLLLLFTISRRWRVFIIGFRMKILISCLFFLLPIFWNPALLAAASSQDNSPQTQSQSTKPQQTQPAPDKSSPARNPDQTGAANQSPPVPKAQDKNSPPDATGEEANSQSDTAENGESNLNKVNEAWQVVWSGQREMVNEIRDTALSLSEAFSSQTKNLAEELRPYEEEGRRLLVFTNTFHGHPNAMEAVNRRLGAIIQGLNQVLSPVNEAREEAESLLARINQMAQNLPTDIDKENLAPEMRSYMDDITRTRFRLMGVIAQYDSILPFLELVRRLEDSRNEISQQLPELWKNRYMQKPVPWLSPELWLNTAKEVSYSWQAVMLRLPVEIPLSTTQWSTALMRFFIGLIFSSVATLILRRRWLNQDSSPASKHIFSVSLPFVIFGFAFLGSSISASGEFFRVFLAFGSLCMILGQVFLAWDLRCIQYPEEERRKAPFLALTPLVFGAYVLLYLPLTAPLTLVLWTVFLIIALCRPLKKIDFSTSHFQLESGVLDSYALILWICLFISVSGFQIYSMALYLAFVSLSVVTELIFGGMSLVGVINEHLPQEGARAVLARLLVALAAPFVVVVAIFGLILWILIIPGGTYLLAGYALKGITIGATQFNIVQILLILSAFYLTRTIVSMGTRFLSKLPQKGLHFDATLITPLQTALTYSAWAIFGLFVLRSLGMQLSSLAMVAGGLSVGIGFGMQTIVNNFLSGLILIFGRNLQVGDMVDVGGVIGRVRKISVRATMVETPDNAMIYVPNAEFMSQKLINWTSFSRSVRKKVDVGVAYGSDTELVTKLLIDIAKQHDNVLKYPAPNVIFTDFAASTLNFTLRFWVTDYDVGVRTSSDIRMSINKIFAENDIEIAFPQLDVHLKDAPKDICCPTFNTAQSRPAAPRSQPAIFKGLPPISPTAKKSPNGGRLMRVKKRITAQAVKPSSEEKLEAQTS